MKIQCSCGQKYAFDVTPEMVANPIRFVCHQCGLDSSDPVNQLIRREFANQSSAAAPAPSGPAAAPAARSGPALTSAPPAPPRPPVMGVGLKVAPVQGHAHAPSASVAPPASASTGAGSPGAGAETARVRACTRHPGEAADHECVVCHKPMCPQCMRVTGLVCSPLCRSKAEAQGIAVPEYAGQRDVADRRRWRKVASVVGAIATVVLIGLGFWTWYAWFGSVPKVVYAQRFPFASSAGQLHLAARDQLVVLHGGVLSRHNLETRQAVWSIELIDRDRIARDSAAELEEMKKRRDEAILNGADRDAYRLPTLNALTKANTEAAAAAFTLEVSGENIWLASADRLVRYGWADGKSDKEIPIDETLGEPRRSGDMLFYAEDRSWGGGRSAGEERTLRVNLATGETQATGPSDAARSAAGAAPAVAGAARAGKGARPGGTNAANALAAAPNASGRKPINPGTVAQRAQNLPMPNRLALPATIAAAANQQRLQAALDEDGERPAVAARAPGRGPAGRTPPEEIARFQTADGPVEFGVRLLELRIVEREAMKAPPKKSALEGTVNAAATADIANELLNEMQRDQVGSTVQEDESRYQVTVRRPGQTVSPWTGEVIGAPSWRSLKTVDVITAGKALVVLDRSNKKLWDGKLSFGVVGGSGDDGGEGAGERDYDADGHGRLSAGAGPLVERPGVLYVCDQGMLTCFNLADGNVRWRLPSVGIHGLWFDRAGMIYVNTTTASPDSIRYSKQIDISDKVHNRVLKVDPQDGRTLWTAHNEGHVTYIWDDYIYTVESNAGVEDEEEAGLLGIRTGLEIPPHIRLKRLDASNGRVKWQHYQQRYPLDVHFERNTIQLLFRKEVQNLRFIVL